MDTTTPKVGDDVVEELHGNPDGTREEEAVQTWDGIGLEPVGAPCQKDANYAPEHPSTEPHNQPTKPSSEAWLDWPGEWIQDTFILLH